MVKSDGRRRDKRDVLADLGWGALWGFLLALSVLLMVSLVYVFRGPELLQPYGVTFGSVAALYLLGGLIGGLVLGLLRPLVRWRWGGALVGVVVALPCGLGIRFLQSGMAPWTLKDSVVLSFFALALGGSLGWIYWGISRDISRDRE